MLHDNKKLLKLIFFISSINGQVYKLLIESIKIKFNFSNVKLVG